MGLAVGIASVVAGLLPWIVGGARLPLQNLWATSALPAQMPFALLPVSQYHATTILALLVTGGAIAGAVRRFWSRRRRLPLLSVLLGVLVMHVVAIAQSFVVVGRGHGIGTPAADPRAVLYVGGMLGGTIGAALVALLVLWLLSRAGAVPFALGVGVAAAPFAMWLAAWLWLFGPGGTPPVLAEVVRWLPAVFVGSALGWCGARPPRRLLVWVADLALVWLTPAMLTSISYGLGMRVLGGDLREMAAAAREVFPLVVREGATLAAAALVLAVVVAVARARAPGCRRH